MRTGSILKRARVAWLGLALAVIVSSVVWASTTITLYSAYNVASATYVYNSSGDSGADDGWTGTANNAVKSIVVTVTTFNATSITIQIEGRDYDATNAANVDYVIYEKAYTATNSGDKIVVPENTDLIRVGIKLAGDTGDQSVTIAYNHRS